MANLTTITFSFFLLLLCFVSIALAEKNDSSQNNKKQGTSEWNDLHGIIGKRSLLFFDQDTPRPNSMDCWCKGETGEPNCACPTKSVWRRLNVGWGKRSVNYDTMMEVGPQSDSSQNNKKERTSEWKDLHGIIGKRSLLFFDQDTPRPNSMDCWCKGGTGEPNCACPTKSPWRRLNVGWGKRSVNYDTMMEVGPQSDSSQNNKKERTSEWNDLHGIIGKRSTSADDLLIAELEDTLRKLDDKNELANEIKCVILNLKENSNPCDFCSCQSKWLRLHGVGSGKRSVNYDSMMEVGPQSGA